MNDPEFAVLGKGKKEAIRPPIVAWSLVFLANLPVPLYFGVLTTSPLARVGMVLGIVVLYLLGYRACHQFREVVVWLIYGASIIALFQLLPMVHLIAGMFGVAAAGFVEGGGVRPISTEVLTIPGGFVSTIITGGILIALAHVLGLILWGLKYLTSQQKHAYEI